MTDTLLSDEELFGAPETLLSDDDIFGAMPAAPPVTGPAPLPRARPAGAPQRGPVSLDQPAAPAIATTDRVRPLDSPITLAPEPDRIRPMPTGGGLDELDPGLPQAGAPKVDTGFPPVQPLDAPPRARGQIEAGNIDLTKRPVVKNADGSISTVRSMSIGVDGKEVLIPTVSDDGRVMPEQEAIDTFKRTGRHLGTFDTPESATAYAKQLHDDQAKQHAPKERPWAFTRGFVSGMIEKNPEITAEALEGLSHLADDDLDLKNTLAKASKDLRGLYKGKLPEQYKTTAGSMWDIKGIGDALTWAGETVGQGIASTVPSLITGTGGALMGGRIAGKPGAVAGALGGAAVPSAVMSFGEVYKAVKEALPNPGAAGGFSGRESTPDEIARQKELDRLAATAALYAAGPMVLLDTASIGPIVMRLGGIAEVKRQVARNIAQRIAAEGAKGLGREGFTEMVQEMVKDATVSIAADKPFWTVDHAKGWVESGVGGALTGGVMGGAAGIRPDKLPAPAPAPSAPDPDPFAPAPPGPSSPEEMADFLRQADATKPPPGPQPAPPPDPLDPIREFATAKGLSPEQVEAMIRGMSEGEIATTLAEIEAQRAKEAARAKPAEPPPTSPPEGEGVTPGPEKPQQDQAPQPEGVTPDDRGLLRAYGYDDATIDAMGPAERAAEVSDAIEAGVQAAPVNPAATGAAQDAGTAKTDQASNTDQSEQGASHPGHVDLSTASDLQTVETAASADYTPAQGEANNRKLGHAKWQGLNLSIETPAGGVRRGVDARSGKPWETTMGAAYGYIRGTKGADGMHIDVFVGDKPESGTVFVLNENDHKTGKFRQTKTFIGFDSEQAAREAYLGTSSKDPDGIGSIVPMPVDEFKAWLKEHDHAKPAKAGKTVEVTQRKGKPTGPLSLLQMIAHRGGLKPDAELRAIGMSSKNRVLIPGVGHRSVIRGAGMDMDQLAEAMVEEGFLTEEPGDRPGDSGLHNRIRDMIDGELRGRPVRSMAEQGAQTDTAGADEMAGLRAEVEAMLAEVGETPAAIAEFERLGLVTRTAQIMGAEGLSADAAWEKAVMATALEDEHLTPDQIDDTFGEGTTDAIQSAAAPESSVADERPDDEGRVPSDGEARPQEADSRPGDEPASEGERSAEGRAQELTDAELFGEALSDEPETASQATPSPPSTEATPAGEQGVLPGTEKISDAERAQRESDKPLRPSVNQKPADDNLFGDGDKQTDLVDEARKPPPVDLKVNEPAPVNPAPEGGVSASKPERIEDAGEKIGGARKDKFGGGLKADDLEGMTGAERAKAVTKQNVWARPDYADMVENQGVEAETAFLIKRVYDRIPTGPEKAEDQAGYIELVRAVRDQIERVKTHADLRAAQGKFNEARTGKPGNWSSDDLGPILQRRPKGRGYIYEHPLDYSLKDSRAAKKAVEEGFPNLEPWQRYFETRASRHWNDEKREYETAGFVIARKGEGRPFDKNLYATIEEAREAGRKAYENFDHKREGEEPKRPHLDNIERTGPDYRGGKDVTSQSFIDDFGFRGVEFGNWVASDERQKTVNLAYDALHDLARVLKIPVKALSLNGTLSVAFGARGMGGKHAAHYEPGRLVINMTKLTGAGSLSHEYLHALDHYLGEVNQPDAYKTTPRSVSNGRVHPKHHTYTPYRLGNLSPRLAQASVRLMEVLFKRAENDADLETRVKAEVAKAESNLKAWTDHRARTVEAIRKKQKQSRSLTKIDDAITYWARRIEGLKKQGLSTRPVETDYFKEAKKLSGSSGQDGYWARPEEMMARAFEAYVFDKLAADGHASQYLVQGVEPDRFKGGSYRGNPYPAGEDRTAINKAFDKFVAALTANEGKHGAKTKLEGTLEPEPEEVVTETAEVPEITTEEKFEQLEEGEAAADENLPLADRFAAHFQAGKDFPTIIQARKFAKDAGFGDDPKAIEEAIELGVVKAARAIVAAGEDPAATFKALIDLYQRQPRLGTRTSTSVRDQAYSTPVPLAYIASRLAGITGDTSVLEPTAGNGALLIEASPEKTTAIEANKQRAENLRAQGFDAKQHQLTGDRRDAGDRQIMPKGVDVVIANPPFGVVMREDGQSISYDMGDIQPGYVTKEIDHAISLRALASMQADGSAVLIIGGPAKTATTPEARSSAYNGKAKREFFKTLYDRYNVVDHFGVAGELYERQGAGWPVDVIVIEGRGKSARKLPAVDVPRMYRSWDELGGLVNGRRDDAIRAGEQAGDADQPVVRPDGGNGGLPGNPRGEGNLDGRPGSEQPDGVQPGPVPGDATDAQPGAGGGRKGLRSGERGNGAGAGPQPDPVDFDTAFDNALDDVFGPQAGPKSSSGPAKPRDTRTTKRVLKDTVASGTEAADAAMAGLVELFGGGKTVGSGPAFDEATYAKAKPLFIRAAAKFAEFAGNVVELVRRMVGEMQRVYGLTREGLEKMRPFLRRFMDEVGQGIVKLGEAEAAPKPEIRASAQQEQATDSQVPYVPKSDAPGLGTLVPVNMRTSIEQALAAIEERVGNIGDFVASELGYAREDLGRYFGAEQVDALALAIDNLKRGKGFIIGDQTGIGKGRVNAGIIRWSIANKYVPIFVTEKPNLYGDMYRDLTDIGIQDYLGREPNLIMTNSGETTPLDEEGKMKLRSGSAEAHKKLMDGLSAENLGHDVVFTTYNQMQTVQGKTTSRQAFLSRLAPNAVVIFDESHNAGGQKASGWNKKQDEAPEAVGRAGFARKLIAASGRVFYSSATYAKRPDVMDLYSATDMSMAVSDPSELGEAIASGGVPMQQAVAAMLAEAGQYIRRERSFAGVTYDTPVVPADRDQYNGISNSLAAIQAFSKIVKAVTKTISDDLKGEAGGAGINSSTGDAGASSVNFTATMHNLINQMLLALKVEAAADMAIEALKSGKKPVLTVANTMESFLNDYAAEMGVEVGGVVEADFSRVLIRYLERSRTITIRKPFMAKGEKAEKLYLTDAQLGPAGRAAYEQAKAQIEALDLSGLPISPIDAIKNRIAKAGYTVSEITGRGTIVDYSGPQARLRHRPGTELSIKGRRAAISGYNSGAIDALVINQAGATGLSLHASERFKDQRRRKMIIVQAEANIDTHMQMLGRVHRTGQVITPEYAQLIADIPAEKRPAAVLAKKMASLNANTTASRGGALTAKDVPDFINQYGDSVAHALISDDPEMNLRLGSPLHLSESGSFEREDAMRKLTGRIPLLPLEKQEEIYAQLEAEYDALLKQMDAAGENALEAKSLDLKAQTIERTTVVPAKGGSNSPFAAPVVMEKVKANRLGKPYTSEEVVRRVLEELELTPREGLPTDAAYWLSELSGKTTPAGTIANHRQHEVRKTALVDFEAYKRSILDELEDEKKVDSERTRLDAIKDRWNTILSMTNVGARVTLRTSNGNLSGVVLKTEQKGEPKNPLALSTWKVTVAIPDASRQITLPFSRLWERDKSDPDSDMAIEIEPTPDWIEGTKQTAARFDNMQSEVKEDRYIATGNVLAAYEYLSLKGQIVHFTDGQGNVRQGVLTARNFDLAKHDKTKLAALQGPDAVKGWLDANRAPLSTSDGFVVLTRHANGHYIIDVTKAKRDGGRYYLDKQLIGITGDFYSRGNKMVSEFYEADALRTIARLQALGAKFTASAGKKLETEKVEPKEAQRVGRLTPAAADRQREIIHAVRAAIAQVAGFETAQRAELVPEIDRPFDPAWGDVQGAVVGLYRRTGDLITISLAGEDQVHVAMHEGWHSIEGMLTAEEKALLTREADRLRDYVARNGRYTRKELAGIADDEVFAEAAATYASTRRNGVGLHIGVRRILDKLYEIFARIRNALRGMGFQAAEDVFTRFERGEMAQRRERKHALVTESALDAIGAALRGEPATFEEAFPQFGEQLARRRRTRVPGAPVTAEDIVVAERLADRLALRGHDMLAGITQRLGFGDRVNLGRLDPNEARTRAQDKFIRIKRLQNAVEEVSGQTTPQSLNTYQAESLYYGRVGQQLERFEKGQIDPLLEDMQRRNITLEEIDDYLYARHAGERNAYLRPRNPRVADPSGMSDADAQAILSSVAASGRQADFDAIEQRVRAIIDATRAHLVRSGLMSQAQANAWEQQYQNYVPLRGWAEGTEEDETLRTAGSGYDVRGPEARTAFGRSSEAGSPLSHILLQAELAIVRAEKNRVGRHFFRFAQANPMPHLYRVDQARLVPQFDSAGLVHYVQDASHIHDESTFRVKIGGQIHFITFEGPAGKNISRALKNIGTQDIGPVLRVVGLLTRTLARLATTWNPDFTVPNFFRDAGEAFINLQAEQQRQIVKRFSRHLMPAMGGAMLAIGGRTGGRYAAAFRAFDRAGGRIRFFGMENSEDIEANIRSKLRRLHGGLVNNTITSLGQATEALDVVQGAVENATRLAAFMAARDVGMTDTAAAALARDLTVNFNRKGEMGGAISALWMFANAALQGTTRMVQALGSRRVQKAVLALAAISAALAIYNIGAGGDDDDGTPYYLKLPHWDRDKNLIVMWPKGFGMDGKTLAMIPLPYGFSMFSVLGSRLASAVYGNEKPTKAMGAVVGSVMEAFDPLGKDENKVAQFFPTIGKPGVHLYMNENWTGRPINPTDPYKRKADVPDAYKHFRTASEFSIDAADKMNRATGGDRLKSGLVDVSPGTIDYTLRFLTGGLGQFVKNTTTTATSLATGEPVDPEKVPILRRFYADARNPASDNQAYHEAKDRMRVETGRVRSSVKQGVEHTPPPGFEGGPARGGRGMSFRVEGGFRRTDRWIKKEQEIIDAARLNKNLSQAERRAIIEPARERIRQLQNDARRDFNRATGQ